MLHERLSDTLDQICEKFLDALSAFTSGAMLSREMLQDYSKSKWRLHGLLEAALVKAGWQTGFLPVLEPRVPLSTPLVPSKYDSSLNGKRKRHQFRPDVGLYGQRLSIFAECFTIDEAHEFSTSKGKGYVTRRDSILHFVNYANPRPSGMLICTVLPHKVTKKPSWKELKPFGDDFFTQLKPEWDKLAQTLQHLLPTKLIVIEEGGVWINGVHQSLPIP